MDFFTASKNYFTNYTLEACVTNDVQTLKSPLVNECYKVVFIESGTIHIELNGCEYILTGANALCLNEKDSLTVYESSEDSITILYFMPSVINNKFNFDTFRSIDLLSISEQQDLQYLSQFQYNCTVSSKILPLHAINADAIKKKFQLLNELLLLQNTPHWPCLSRSYLFEILFSFIRPEKESKNDGFLPNLIDSNFSKRTIEVIYYLQTHYSKKITIEKLAQEFHTNRTTLLDDFKKSTGQSINRYLTQFRINMAATLLRDTKLPINDICERIGFYDISYFCKTFKKEINFTPSEYRHINDL